MEYTDNELRLLFWGYHMAKSDNFFEEINIIETFTHYVVGEDYYYKVGWYVCMSTCLSATFSP